MAKSVARYAFITGIVFVLLALSPHRIHAWGDTAHRIICEVAFRELNPTVRTEVRRLIKLDPDFSTFSDSCTWPDHPRKRSREHFVNLPRSATELGNDLCPLADKCLVTAIEVDLEALADAGASDANKLDALKFLGHWVGDVHQPMHVSFQDDRGGNRIGESGRCERNLHAVWDSCIVETKLGSDIKSIATNLRGAVTVANRNQWNITGPKAWANESFKITTSAAVGYCIQKDSACWYASDNRELDRNEIRRVVVVDDAYMERQLPTVKKHLTLAGVRLAGLLNEVLVAQRGAQFLPNRQANSEWNASWIHWLNTNQGFVMGLLTLVYVVATVGIAIIMIRSNRLSRRSLQQALELDKKRSRPYVVFDIELRERLVFAVLRNYGLTGAHKIKLVLSPLLQHTIGGKIIDSTLVFNEIGFLAPSRVLEDFLDPDSAFFDHYAGARFEGKLEYEDSEQQRYEEPVRIDLTAQKGLHSVRETHLENEVQKLTQAVGQLSQKIK